MDYFKVLVVHRQEVMLNEVKSILERFGPYLRSCQCGIDGLQVAKLEPFDLILCGTDLPLITGFEMIRSIRNLSRNCLTPVIFIADQLVEGHTSLSRQLKSIGIVAKSNLRANLDFVMDNTTSIRGMTFLEPKVLTAFN